VQAVRVLLILGTRSISWRACYCETDHRERRPDHRSKYQGDEGKARAGKCVVFQLAAKI